jgi:hypothetical protein
MNAGGIEGRKLRHQRAIVEDGRMDQIINRTGKCKYSNSSHHLNQQRLVASVSLPSAPIRQVRPTRRSMLAESPGPTGSELPCRCRLSIGVKWYQENTRAERSRILPVTPFSIHRGYFRMLNQLNFAFKETDCK